MPDGRRAILSVSDKRGISDFARGLVSVGYTLLATDGTAKALRAEGVPVESVSEYTGQPEVLGGRPSRSRPSSTRAGTTPRSTPTSPAARGRACRTPCASPSRRPRTSATGRTRTRRPPCTGSPRPAPGSGTRSGSAARNSPTTTSSTWTRALASLKGKKKGAFLVMRTRGEFRGDHGLDMVHVLGGVLLQTTDFPEVRPAAWKVVTRAKPTADQLRDMAFGVRVSRYVKSNSIVLSNGERTVGIGAGQMSRVDACMLACYKAGKAAKGSVAVSDAYFPFRDGLDELGKGGVAAVAQPGGSIRDDEVIASADEHGIAMAF